MTLTPAEVRRLPFGRFPTVHVCVRDDASAPEDALYAVHVNDKLGQLVISLQADDLEDGWPVCLQHDGSHPDRVWLHLGGVEADGDGAAIPLDSYRCYVGNILWDAGLALRGEAIRLVIALLERGFHVDEVVEVEP